MPSASAVTVETIGSLVRRNNGSIVCTRGYTRIGSSAYRPCGHPILVDRAVVCSRRGCKADHNIDELIVIDAQENEERLEAAIHRQRIKFWDIQVHRRADRHRVELRLGLSAPVGEPEWVSKHLHWIFMFWMIPVFLPELRHWMWVSKFTRPGHQASYGREHPMNPIFVAEKDLEEHLTRVNDMVCTHTSLRVRLPHSVTEWEAVQAATQSFNGRWQPGFNWERDARAWIQVQDDHRGIMAGGTTTHPNRGGEDAALATLIIDEKPKKRS